MAVIIAFKEPEPGFPTYYGPFGSDTEAVTWGARWLSHQHDWSVEPLADHNDHALTGNASTQERLVSLIEPALALADQLGLTATGIALNEALVTLDGEGRPPLDLPGEDPQSRH